PPPCPARPGVVRSFTGLMNRFIFRRPEWETAMVEKGSGGGGAARRRVGAVAALGLVAALGAAGVPAGPAAASPGWRSYVLGPASARVAPAAVETRGQVSHPRTLVTGRGKATTLTTVAGQAPASVLL